MCQISHCELSYEKLSNGHKAFTSKITNLFVPKNIPEALNDWIDALKQNCTRYIIELPKEKKTVGCKQVFMVKCKVGGSVERYKARLVAKGLLKPMELIIKKHLLQVLKSILLQICCLLWLTLIGLFINWMLRMPFSCRK